MIARPTNSFVDTNVLVYANDKTAGHKRDTAKALVSQLWESGRGCLSVQVLQELFVTVTRKLPHPLDADTAGVMLSDFAHWQVHAPSPDDVLAAVDIHRRHGLSFWDAMILRSAGALGCEVLYTEDLNSGQVYDGVQAHNPFD